MDTEDKWPPPIGEGYSSYMEVWHKPPPGISEWESLSESGCAFDFIASSAILEWLGKQKAIQIDEEPDIRFQRYRDFSKYVDANNLVHQLIFFEKIYLNIGVYYKRHLDLGILKRYGFFEEYPRPPDAMFSNSYRLIRPLALQGIAEILRDLINVPYDELWDDIQAKSVFRNYDGLVSWLYNEYAKDACGQGHHAMDLMDRIKDQYVFKILDFMEFAVHAQGCLAESNLPMFSSVLRARSGIPSSDLEVPESLIRDDVFALYQIASKDVLGRYIAFDSFGDVLRLREDKRVIRIRELLGNYQWALNESDEQIVKEVSNEIVAAKEALGRFDFSEHPVWLYIVKPLSLAPVVGIAVSIIDLAIDFMKAWQKRKHGWIYFGDK